MENNEQIIKQDSKETSQNLRDVGQNARDVGQNVRDVDQNVRDTGQNVRDKNQILSDKFWGQMIKMTLVVLLGFVPALTIGLIAIGHDIYVNKRTEHKLMIDHLNRIDDKASKEVYEISKKMDIIIKQLQHD